MSFPESIVSDYALLRATKLFAMHLNLISVFGLGVYFYGVLVIFQEPFKNECLMTYTDLYDCYVSISINL